jgi:hypothetical protein
MSWCETHVEEMDRLSYRRPGWETTLLTCCEKTSLGMEPKVAVHVKRNAIERYYLKLWWVETTNLK